MDLPDMVNNMKQISLGINSSYCIVKWLKTSFRISCFTTSPYSQLMWASYADNHRGFCVEYTVLPNDDLYKNIYYNLLPVIYCKSRPNIAAGIEFVGVSRNPDIFEMQDCSIKCDECPRYLNSFTDALLTDERQKK